MGSCIPCLEAALFPDEEGHDLFREFFSRKQTARVPQADDLCSACFFVFFLSGLRSLGVPNRKA